jgi:hypothetical protein
VKTLLLMSVALASLFVINACTAGCDPVDRYYEVSAPDTAGSPTAAHITADSYERCAANNDCLPLCREAVGSNTVLDCKRVATDGAQELSSRIGLLIKVQFHCS